MFRASHCEVARNPKVTEFTLGNYYKIGRPNLPSRRFFFVGHFPIYSPPVPYFSTKIPSAPPLFCRFKPRRSPKRPFQVQTAIRIRLCLNRAGNRLKMPPSHKIHAPIPSQNYPSRSIKTAAKHTKSKKHGRQNDRIPKSLLVKPAKSALSIQCPQRCSDVKSC